MISNKNKLERFNYLSKSNSSNNTNGKNIILVNHSKNKSADLKLPKISNYLLSLKENLKEENFKSNLNPRNKIRINLNKEKEINRSIMQLHKSISNLKNSKISISPNKPINRKINKKVLKKYVSVPNLIEKNKKKYFLSPNFFNRNNNKKNKLNQKTSNKKTLNNSNSSYVQNKKKNNKYSKRIIKRNYMSENNNKSNFNKEEIFDGKKIKENEDSKNCDISSNDNNSYGIKDLDIRKPIIKSNLLYIKGKIKEIPYKNKKCSSYRTTQKINDNKNRMGKKNESMIKFNNNILNDSLDSHNTIYDEDIINIKDLKLINNKLKNENIKGKAIITNNDKLYKKIISRKRNLLTGSLNNSNLNKEAKYFSSKNYNSTNDNISNSVEKIFLKTGDLKTQNIYRKIHSKKLSILSNNFSSSSLLTTQHQTNKEKEKANIIINKDVTEFLYTDDINEGTSQGKEINLKKWLSDINLSPYYQNFYENNINNINELVNKMKETEDKKLLYEFIENTFHIHIPGHIYRILLKLEVDAGLLDKKISNFLIDGDDENRIKFNKLKPSLLLRQNNSCENCFNCYGDSNSSIIKNKLKYFLKKYHLIGLYYNYFQNGFDIINFVLLQMFSNYYEINENILENCFHIYNIKDRFLVMEALLNEKNIINSFINSDKYKKNNNSSNLTYDNLIFNSSFYNNNIDSYMINESERNNCNICNIY